MKKSLFLGLVALAFVSCSKDNFSSSDIPSGGSSGSVEDTYANNFIKTFGTPAANQTWGFGKAANFAKSMRRADAVIPDDHPFTFENTDSYYKTEIPGTAKDPNDVPDWQVPNLTQLKLVNASYSIRLDNGSRDIYVSGTVTLNVDATHPVNQARFYVLPNATLTLNMSSEYPIRNMEIYVAANGVLNYSSAVLEKNMNQTGGGKIYNRGTVNFLADEFQANNDAVIYNEGNVTGKSIKLAPNQNNPSFFYNFGDVNLTKNLILFSNSNFLNEGNVEVKENTEITGTVQEGYTIWWINKSHFETKNMVMHATNNKLYNLCQLFVKETLNVYEGEFNLLPNSYTEAGSAEFHMFYINMYGDAGINIKGDVYVSAKYNGTFDQGFKYKDGDDNYVMIGGKCSVNLEKGTLNIDEGITYAVKEVVILNDGSPMTEKEAKDAYPNDVPVTIFNATSGVEFGKLSVTPNTTDCGATWTIGTLPETLPSLHVMAEDLSAVEASDFDFNDVVIDVFYVDANTVKIVLLAAGGTLPLIIAEKDDWEVHKLFDVPVTCMVNTGKKYHVAQPPYSQVEGKAAVELTLTGKTWSKDQDEFAAQVNQQIKLHVYKDGAWFELKAEQGKPACKIATPVEIFNLDWYPTEYRWPWEKQNIGNDFKNWVENPLVKWYTTRKSLEETNAE